ncbi:MAG TPA: MFS transporter [Solirubrobacteraceae bacterium]|nr:MFS transporter [Solirubrobacteraceae bacterium]
MPGAPAAPAPPPDASGAVGLARFRALLRTPGVARIAVSSLFARLPFGTETLALLLYVQDATGSFGSGGLVSAALALSSALAMPFLGRLVDRLGQTPVLLATAAVHVCAISLVLVLGAAGAPTWSLVLAAASAGIYPPISPALRGLWGPLLGEDEERVRTALALDAVLLELVFIGGPLLAAAIFAFASPAAALVAVLVLATGGTLAFASSEPSRAWRGGGGGGHVFAVLASPGMRTLLYGALPVGVALGAIDVALPAFGVEHGNESIGAAAIACLAVGSAAGGIVYGVRVPSDVRRTYLALVSALPLGVLLLAAAGPTWTLFALAPIAGAVIAPLTATENELTAHVAPEGTVTEAYSWVIMAMAGGISVGAAAGGALVDTFDWRAAILAGAAVSALATLAVLTRRITLA